jgi:1-acyl-sn-glycerol-3-phosphate acyltransferase
MATKMKLFPRFVALVCRLGLEAMYKIEKQELAKVPAEGPLICYANHTGMAEVPILFTELLPRPVTGIAKIESWDNWFLRWIFTMWNAIPIRRGEADMQALHSMLLALENGYFVGLSPEGTRNKTGVLLQAHPGVVLLALKSGAPLMPVAHWGSEKFSQSIRRFKRTPFQIRCGRRFYLDARGERVTKEVRQEMVDEMMYQLAKLLPAEYRGIYADLDNASEKHLRFID